MNHVGPPGDAPKERIRGLDTLRFVMVMWVVLSHIEPRLAFGTHLLVQRVYDNLFCGAAAVVVFFVMFGFCVHNPQRQLTRLPLIPYCSRRNVRILAPLAADLHRTSPKAILRKTMAGASPAA